MPKNGYHPIELRIQILGLISWGVDAKDIAEKLEVPIRSIRKMIQRAKDRGFNPGSCERIRMEYAEDAKRSGRPKEITPEKEKAVIESVSKDRNGTIITGRVMESTGHTERGRDRLYVTLSILALDSDVSVSCRRITEF
jgi:transposase